MRPPRVAVTALALGLAACARRGERTDVASSHVSVADDDLSSVAVVYPDHLEVPAAGHEDLLSLPAGTILVGGRTAQNPGGFLRRVTSASLADGGDTIYLAAQPAALSEAIVDGELAATLEPATMDPGASQSAGAGLHLQTLGQIVSGTHDFSGAVVLSQTEPVSISSSNFDVHEDVNVAQGSFTFVPRFVHDIQFSGGSLQSADLSLEADVDVALALDVDVHADVDLELDHYSELKPAHSRKRLFSFPRVALPPQFIGILPVYEAVEVDVDLGCDFKFRGTVHVETGGSAHFHVAAGASYADGAWTPTGDPPSLDTSARFQVSAPGSVEAVCYVEPMAQLVFYDVAGPYVGVGPYLDAQVQLDDSAGTLWAVYPGASAELGGDLSVFDREVAWGSVPIFDWESASPIAASNPPPSGF